MRLRSRNKITTEFNMSSMTDLVFLLLIFFMLLSTLVTNQAVMDLTLPKSDAKGQPIANSLRVSISKELKYYINNNEVPFDQLETQLAAIAGDKAETKVEVAIDEDVPHKYFVELANIVSEKLGYKLILITEKGTAK